MAFNVLTSQFGITGVILLLWVIAWKGIALWIAARNGSKPWFIVLLIINTLGILEILYVFFFSKMGKNKIQAQENNTII